MEAFFLFILKALFVFALACFAVALCLMPGAKREREAAEKARKEKSEQEQRLQAMNSAFIEEQMKGWNDIAPALINGDRGYIAMSDNGLLLRFACPAENAETLELKSEKTFSITSILSYNVVIPEGTKTVTHKEKVPVAVKEKRSTVGRAVVGGVLLGPVGAAVGAASGLNGKDKVQYHEVERKETVAVKGAARLVLGLKDSQLPKLTIQFDRVGMANDWWYKIQAAKA